MKPRRPQALAGDLRAVPLAGAGRHFQCVSKGYCTAARI